MITREMIIEIFTLVDDKIYEALEYCIDSDPCGDDKVSTIIHSKIMIKDELLSAILQVANSNELTP